MYDSNQRLWWRKTKFAINNTKLYVPVVTLSAQWKTIAAIKTGLKRTINWKKY